VCRGNDRTECLDCRGAHTLLTHTDTPAYAPWKKGDQIVGWLASVNDVTDRRHAEEELKTADRGKDEFLATLAHELRSPLAAIRTLAHLLHRFGPSANVVGSSSGRLTSSRASSTS